MPSGRAPVTPWTHDLMDLHYPPMRWLALLVGLAALAPAGGLAQYDPFASVRRVRIGGTELAYVEQGQGGTPVIFVHGSGADLRTWGYQLQFFGKSRRAIAYSRRYHHPNRFEGDGSDYAPALHADDLAGVITTLTGGRADIVAASYGGVVALLVARDRPALVRRLVLVEPVAFGLLPDDAPEAAGLDAIENARRHMRAGDPEAALRTFVQAIIAPWAFDLMPGSTRSMLYDNIRELEAEARAPLVSLEPRYTCGDARRVRAETLLIVGGASAPLLKATSDRVARCLADVETRTIEGAAHAVHAQQVQAFNGAVIEFLDRR